MHVEWYGESSFRLTDGSTTVLAADCRDEQRDPVTGEDSAEPALFLSCRNCGLSYAASGAFVGDQLPHG